MIIALFYVGCLVTLIGAALSLRDTEIDGVPIGDISVVIGSIVISFSVLASFVHGMAAF